MIIDCHTHLNRYTPDLPVTLPERHALLREEMAAHGVAYSLVLTSYDVTDERPSTRDVLAELDGDPTLGVVAGIRHAHLAADLPELREVLQAGRLKALKLYPGYEPFRLTDASLRPVYELAAEFGVPVMIHTGDTYDPCTHVRLAHPLDVDDVAVEHRETRLVMCHVGNPWLMDAAEVLYKNPNVFGDISGFTLGEFQPRFEKLMVGKLNDLVAYVNDPGKLMFGTDWPLSGVRGYLEFVRRLDLTDEERDGLLWRNAASVFGLAFEVRVETADDG
ncbi:MAG TPA: amidohydrolase family protein [Longimicrobium sp.]|nr:amidohydrolase family protein [Longimicrobium sp.]